MFTLRSGCVSDPAMTLRFRPRDEYKLEAMSDEQKPTTRFVHSITGLLFESQAHDGADKTDLQRGTRPNFLSVGVWETGNVSVHNFVRHVCKKRRTHVHAIRGIFVAAARNVQYRKIGEVTRYSKRNLVTSLLRASPADAPRIAGPIGKLRTRAPRLGCTSAGQK